MSFLLGIKSWFDPEVYFDDYVDRMSRKHIVTALVVAIVFLATSEFIGDPISCFVPDYYHEEQAAYINSYCWANSIYYLVDNSGRDKWNGGVPKIGSHQAHSRMSLLPEGGRKKLVNYYRWVPVVLMVQCFLFLLPYYAWQALAQSVHGIHIYHVLRGADEIASVDCAGEERELRCAEVAKRLRIYVEMNRSRSRLQRKLFGAKSRMSIFGGSSSLFLSYITSKILYFANNILQLCFLSTFLDINIWHHCWFTIKGVFDSQSWPLSTRFPVATICEYTGEAQVHGRLLRLTCLCSIPLNLYHDKIFSVLAIFMMLMLLFIPFSALVWLRRCVNRQGFLERYFLPFATDAADVDISPRELESFVESHLTVDVIFVLRLMEMNADGVVVALVLEQMWRHFRDSGDGVGSRRRRSHDDDDDDDDGIIRKVPINQMFIKHGGLPNGVHDIFAGKIKELRPTIYPSCPLDAPDGDGADGDDGFGEHKRNAK